MAATRHTAVLSLSFGDDRPGERALDTQRPYRFELTIDQRQVDGGTFRSPLGDEDWRSFMEQLRRTTGGAAGGLRWAAATVETQGGRLYQCLRQLSPDMARFLDARADPRRLVIHSACPEIQRLPWEAMLPITVELQPGAAQSDLSIVRATERFDGQPVTAASPASVHAFFGPGTDRRTRKAFEALQAQIRERGGEQRIAVKLEALPLEGPVDGDIVSVEAHGDEKSGEVAAGESGPGATSLVDRVKGRKMVLLWSCWSGFVHSWGESLAMRLHRADNTFVLAFATDLRFETAEALALGLLGQTFGWEEAVDPETAVARERLRLFQKDRTACEWVSLVLWLRAPLDLSAVALDGPRVMAGGDGGPSARADEIERLERELATEAIPGRLVAISGLSLAGRAPLQLFRSHRGTVVHLRAEDGSREMKAALETLKLAPPSVHRGDAFLAILDHLGERPDSLLLWSGAGDREVATLRLLVARPPRLSLVLVSPYRISDAAGVVVKTPAGLEPAPAPLPRWDSELAQLEATLDAGQHAEAHALWHALLAKRALAAGSREHLRLQVAGYWAAVRLEKKYRDDARRCAEDVKRADAFEGLLLEGNLARREGRHAEARAPYAMAAREPGLERWRRGRATLELAYLANDSGDPGLAERLYREVFDDLQAPGAPVGDWMWSSALGQACRDYADLLAGDRARAAECEASLRRALVIHGLDGRMNQVGSVLKTRAKLARTRQRWDEAERAWLQAVAVLAECGNQTGWVEAMAGLAELGIDRGDLQQALEIAQRVAEKSALQPGQRGRGRVALAAARAVWRMGRLDEVARWSREAVECLPREMPERAQARDLLAAALALQGDRGDR